MTRLLIAAFCSIWMASAAAEAPAPAAPSAAQQIQPQMDVPAAPASAVEGAQPAASGGDMLEPKSAIPIDERRGGDITKCLGDGNRTDQEIAACAEPYSPLHHHNQDHQHHRQQHKKNKKKK